eukprot:m51a1_g7061 hypothetical protein (233) ;mRNA; r:171641-172442
MSSAESDDLAQMRRDLDHALAVTSRLMRGCGDADALGEVLGHACAALRAARMATSAKPAEQFPSRQAGVIVTTVAIADPSPSPECARAVCASERAQLVSLATTCHARRAPPRLPIARLSDGPQQREPATSPRSLTLQRPEQPAASPRDVPISPRLLALAQLAQPAPLERPREGVAPAVSAAQAGAEAAQALQPRVVGRARARSEVIVVRGASLLDPARGGTGQSGLCNEVTW